MQELFLDINFPKKICHFERNIVEFFTIVQKAKNGSENRVILNDIGCMKYVIEGGMMKKSDIETISNFFRIVKGRGFSFRFFDENDNSAIDEILEKISEDTYQLIKTYKFSDFLAKKNITKPIQNTVILKSEEGVLIENTDYIVQHLTGNIKILNPKFLANIQNIRATFNFDVEVRFENDELKISQDKFNNFYLNELTMTEIIY
jgi:uncharacterized protein (TIGR02217 family)